MRKSLSETTHKHTDPTQAFKQTAINAIESLPDDADIDEIMYRLYVLEHIRRGLEDAAQGKTTPAEEVLRQIQSW